MSFESKLAITRQAGSKVESEAYWWWSTHRSHYENRGYVGNLTKLQKRDSFSIKLPSKVGIGFSK